MISVGGRDARKGLALGFGVRGDMEETELEEGEAFSYHNNNESIDPDVALSYIDDKLQDVLGHFQKDFEGGVSAENLGAKFGGYGSFLPTYQRSPLSSHPRTPAKVQTHNSPGSPNNLQMEGGLHNPALSSTASLPLRLGPASTSGASLPALKPLSLNDSVKEEVRPHSTNSSEELAPKYELANRKSSKLSNQKTLKVRIKVGSDNLSARKNAAIYSGLGLDISPSSSLDESPSGSEWMSCEASPYESPTSILQIMTSFPVHGNLLLSPLPSNLLHLTEKSKFVKDGRSISLSKDDGKGLGEKKIKSVAKSDFLTELNRNGKDGHNGIGAASKKEMDIDQSKKDIDAVGCEELVSNTLKLPIFANEVGWAEKAKVESAGKFGEDKKVYSLDDVSTKDSHRKEERSYESVRAESKDPPKQKASQKSTSNEQDGLKLPQWKEPPSLGEKRKSKGSQIRGNLVPEDPKVSLTVGSSLNPKSKKTAHGNSYTSKNELVDKKVPEDLGNARDAYRDFFGDIKLDEEDNQTGSLEMPSEDRLKDLGVNEKSNPTINDALKERSSGKKIEKPSTSEAYHKAVPNIAPHSTTGLAPDGPPLVGPQASKDHWVSCDKCLQWRLLPCGSKPEDLPDKWLCSMLDWLPGMNRCSFTEEETTKAVGALYQVPAVGNQNHLLTVGGDVNLSHQTYGLNAVPGGGKNKNGIREMTNATSKDGLNPVKKNLQAPVKSRKLNDVSQSPLVNKSDSHQVSKSSDLSVEKQRHKHKVAEHHSDGGDTRNLKMKSKRGIDPNSSRSSKKLKTDIMLCADEDMKADHGGGNLKVGTCSSSGLATTAVRKDQLKYRDRSSSRERYDTKDGLQVPAAKPKEKVSGSLDMGCYDDKNVTLKKRNVKESQDCPIHLESSPGLYSQGRRDVIEEDFSENDFRKKKKARVSKSGSSSSSRGHDRTGRKDSHIENQKPGQDLGNALPQRSLDGIDSVKRDLVSVQPPLAATSSSSKISGSNKTKTSFQEVKGSPVESVSSSPMRISDPGKLMLERNLNERDEARSAGFLSVGSPRKYSGGDEDGGSDRSATARKDKNVNANHKSLDPMTNFQVRDCSQLSGGKARVKVESSPDMTNVYFTNGGVNSLSQDAQQKDIHYSANGSRPRKSGKGSSRSKDKHRREKHEAEGSKGKSKISGSTNELLDVKRRDGKNKFQENLEGKSDEIENKDADNKILSAKLSSESSKRGSRPKFEVHDGPDVKEDVICSQDALSFPKQNLHNHDAERSSKRSLFEKNEERDLASGKGKLSSLPPSGGGQNEILSRCPRPVSGSHKGNEADKLAVDASEVDDALKVQKQLRKNGQQTTLSHSTSSENRVRDHDAPSPLRRDSSSHAASIALKEAKDLKHRADRKKNTGSNESTELYFEAALKFIRASSLLESCNSENGKQEMQAMQIYSSTAKLFEFCAHEFAKDSKMAFAALAYKCMELAYMRVVYSSHSGASRDRHELQAALQIVPPGESPSSSASDVDNLNNLTTADKVVTLPKSAGSPQVVGNHTIAARHRPNFLRLLNFTHDVHFAMEASRKSMVAFAAANASLKVDKEGLSSVKRALDFSFQDVEGFLRVVRLAIEVITPCLQR